MDNYSKPSLRFDSFALCLPVVQNLSLCPPEVPSVRDLLPTSPFAVRKTHYTFLEKNKHNKDKKVRVFYFLRTSMRTKHRDSTDQMLNEITFNQEDDAEMSIGQFLQ